VQEGKGNKRLTYRIGEASAMLGISRWALDRLINNGQVGIVRLGTLRVIPADELDRIVRQGFERRKVAGE
jgi:excisionase family DNA binding protein